MVVPAWSDPPELRPLRAGLDWANLLFDAPISRGRWLELAAAESLELVTPHGPLTLSRSGPVRRGEVDSLAWSGDGLLVRAVSPERYALDPASHAARVDVQGLWCSTASDGLAAVEGARAAVASALWPERAAVPCVGGRLDLFCDVEVRAPLERGAEWVEREVFRSGNADRIFAGFVTRANEKSRALTTALAVEALREGRAREHKDHEPGRYLGGARLGRTRVLGRDPRVMSYEADKDPSRDKALVRDRWRERGWSGETRVIRTEVRVSRDWFTDNELELENGARVRLAGSGGLSWDEVRPHLPAIARALLLRTRETDVRDRTARLDRRRSSPLWLANLEGFEVWSARLAAGELPDWSAVPELVSRRRVTSIERATRRAELAIAELWTHARADRPETTPHDVGAAVGAAIWDGAALSPVDALDARARRTATVCALPLPPSVSLPEQRRREEQLAPAVLAASRRMSREELDAELLRIERAEAGRPLERADIGWRFEDEVSDG